MEEERFNEMLETIQHNCDTYEKNTRFEKELLEAKCEGYKFATENIIFYLTHNKDYFINGFFKDFLNDYISKDKIKALKEKVEKEMISNPYDFSYMINELLGEDNKC